MHANTKEKTSVREWEMYYDREENDRKDDCVGNNTWANERNSLPIAEVKRCMFIRQMKRIAQSVYSDDLSLTIGQGKSHRSYI